MPRRTRIRPGPTSNEGGSDANRQWRARWKQVAVAKLPSTAPRSARVQLRAAVERTLTRVAPETDDAEVEDLVMQHVDEALRQLETDAQRQGRRVGKALLVAQTDQFLQQALDRLKARGTVAMLKRPGYSFGRLRYRLARRLERDLTGDEGYDTVQVAVEAWVEARLAEQPPTRRVSAAALLAGGAAAVTVGVVAGQHPAAQAAAARVVEQGRALAWKGRAVLGQAITQFFTPPGPPTPPAPPGPSVG